MTCKLATVLLAIALLASPAWAAQTLTVKYSAQTGATVYVLTYTWTADAKGVVANSAMSAADAAMVLGLYLVQAETVPGTAPTALYDITVLNASGADVMGGGLANRSATLGELAYPATASPVITGVLTFAISGNSVNAATGTVILNFARDSATGTSSTTVVGGATEVTLGQIKAKTDNIPAQGQALAAASIPVVLPALQAAAIGGGTQYANAAAKGTETGNLNMVTDGTLIRAVPGDTSGHPHFNLWGYGGTAVGVDNGFYVRPGTGATFAVTGTFWQATQPVSGTFWQATQPVSIASMPSTPVTGTFFQTTQPADITKILGSAVSATNGLPVYPQTNSIFTMKTDQTTHGTTDLVAGDITKIGGATLTIGQQLAAASLPVILPSATITTLTPPAAITGFATETSLAKLTLTPGAAFTTQPGPLTLFRVLTTTPISPAYTEGGLQPASVDGQGRFHFNLSTINGTTVVTGTGAQGAGSPRVTVATDTATIAGSAPGTAGTPSAQVITVQGITSGTPIPVVASVADTEHGVARANAPVPIGGDEYDGTHKVQVPYVSTTGVQKFHLWTVAGAETGLVGAPIYTQDSTAQASAIRTIKTDQTTHGTTDLVAADLTKIAGVAIAVDPCTTDVPSYVAISQAADTQLVAVDGTKVIYVCGILAVVTTAEVLNIVKGTGTVCATNKAAIVGSTTDANGVPFGANGGWTWPNAGHTQFKTAAGDALCLTQGGTVQTSGVLIYVQK